MATLRFHLPKLARRTPPSGDAGTSAPTEYPSSSAGALYISCQKCYGYGNARIESVRPDALLARCSRCGSLQWVNDPNDEIVEGDGPQESGVTPSPSIDTDRLNKMYSAILFQATQEINQLTARAINAEGRLTEIGAALRERFLTITAGSDSRHLTDHQFVEAVREALTR